MSEQIASSINSEPQITSGKSKATTAGVAGAGGGTLLLIIANNLKPQNPFKEYLIWAAPSVSVFLGGFWLLFQVKVATYVREREYQSLYNKTKEIYESALSNPTTSTTHKKQIRLKLEQLEHDYFERQRAKLESLKIITEEEIIKRINSV